MLPYYGQTQHIALKKVVGYYLSLQNAFGNAFDRVYSATYASQKRLRMSSVKHYLSHTTYDILALLAILKHTFIICKELRQQLLVYLMNVQNIGCVQLLFAYFCHFKQ